MSDRRDWVLQTSLFRLHVEHSEWLSTGLYCLNRPRGRRQNCRADSALSERSAAERPASALGC
eukprot:7390523-Prymnesium_polylepis.1